MQNYIEMEMITKLNTPKTCSIEGCEKPHLARGWCCAHYRRWHIHGDPKTHIPVRTRHKTPEDSLKARTKLDPETGCIEWIGNTNGHGYGQISVNGKVALVHRYVWERVHGPIPKSEDHHGTCVLHRCDNRRCVNVDHLWLGSQVDNIRDRDAKGRNNAPKGESSGRAKLTEADIRAIRADNRPHRKIATDYGVTNPTICNIKQRNIWKHVK